MKKPSFIITYSLIVVALICLEAWIVYPVSFFSGEFDMTVLFWILVIAFFILIPIEIVMAFITQLVRHRMKKAVKLLAIACTVLLGYFLVVMYFNNNLLPAMDTESSHDYPGYYPGHTNIFTKQCKFGSIYDEKWHIFYTAGCIDEEKSRQALEEYLSTLSATQRCYNSIYYEVSGSPYYELYKSSYSSLARYSNLGLPRTFCANQTEEAEKTKEVVKSEATNQDDDYIDQAIENKDVTFCEQVSAIKQPTCIHRVALTTLDAALCDTIQGDQNYINNCFTALASATNDLSLCDRVQATDRQSADDIRTACINSASD